MFVFIIVCFRGDSTAMFTLLSPFCAHSSLSSSTLKLLPQECMEIMQQDARNQVMQLSSRYDVSSLQTQVWQGWTSDRGAV